MRLPNVRKDLQELLRAKGVEPTSHYLAVADRALGEALSYNTPAMYGMAAALFESERMIAHNLIQNSIDEAKGAARVEIIARRYAPPELKKKMLKHVGDELRHSRQFLSLLKLTSYRSETADERNAVAAVFEFDDELKAFLCRVHSIEIRSWTMLRHYIAILQGSANPRLREAIPVLEAILSDEINHVAYTAEQLIAWLGEENALRGTLAQCFEHTNRETWRDLANMANYLAEHPDALRGAAETAAAA